MMKSMKFGQRGIVGALVGLLVLLEPMTVLAQGRNPKTPPPGYPAPVTQSDPVLDAIAADVVETAKDAHRNGLKAAHTRRQATNLRNLAKHYKDKGVDAQVKAWAKAQNPDVFQFQMPDAKVVDEAIAARRAQGLSTDDIVQALNATPEQKRAALLSLREKGVSESITALAEAFDQLDQVTPGNILTPRITPAQRCTNPAGCASDGGGGAIPRDWSIVCLNVIAAGVSLGLVGVLASFFGPIGLLIGLAIATIGFYMNWWALSRCQGPLPGPIPGSLPVVPRNDSRIVA